MTTSQDRIASFDLHLHTYWSYDAVAHPASYFKRAEALGTRCIAIADHHVLDSLDDVAAAARRHPAVRWIPAAELTVTTSLGAMDMVCLDMPFDAPARLRKALDSYHEWQRECGAAICAGMQALGFDYTDAHRIELLKSYRPAKTIERQGYTHVRNGQHRAYFLTRGFIRTADEYGPLLRQAAERVPIPPYPAAEDVLPAVHDAGGLVAIAHPQGYFNGSDRRRMDAIREECALDGIECSNTVIPPELSASYRAYCVEHGLFSTAGSDCHMDSDAHGKFARHGGEDGWLDEILERIDG